jgi:hypothetical protein
MTIDELKNRILGKSIGDIDHELANFRKHNPQITQTRCGAVLSEGRNPNRLSIIHDPIFSKVGDVYIG